MNWLSVIFVLIELNYENEERIDEKDYLTDALSRETVNFIGEVQIPFYLFGIMLHTDHYRLQKNI